MSHFEFIVVDLLIIIALLLVLIFRRQGDIIDYLKDISSDSDSIRNSLRR